MEKAALIQIKAAFFIQVRLKILYSLSSAFKKTN